jgi:hypothetical protein
MLLEYSTCSKDSVFTDTLGVRAKYVVVDELVGAEWTREGLQSRPRARPNPISRQKKTDFFFRSQPAYIQSTDSGFGHALPYGSRYVHIHRQSVDVICLYHMHILRPYRRCSSTDHL